MLCKDKALTCTDTTSLSISKLSVVQDAELKATNTGTMKQAQEKLAYKDLDCDLPETESVLRKICGFICCSEPSKT